MRRALRPILAVLLVGALAALGWWSLKHSYLEPRAALEARIAKAGSVLERYERGTRDHRAVEAALARCVDRTLGGDRETVDHELRSRLNRIGAAVGLEGPSVGTGRLRSLETPARAAFDRRHDAALRDEIDFVEMEAWIAGQGTLEQVLRLAHRIDAEPWLKRISQVRLQPRENGESFGVTVRLAAIYLPGGAPGRQLPAAATDAPEFEHYRLIARRNPFRVPPEAPPQSVAAAAAVAADAAAEWVLTGVASGPAGPEVWLLNTRTGASRLLAVGEGLRDVVLVAAAGDAAEFRRGDKGFRVTVGNPLIDPGR